jgi:protocatechuate 3,4-dioxygenase beta subunit
MKTIIFMIAVLVLVVFASTTVGKLNLKQNMPQFLNFAPTGGEERQPTGKTGPVPSITCSKTPLPALTEGPYYKSGSPRTQSLRNEKTPGTALSLSGYVLDLNCNPVPNAWIDFWQTDANGDYDNQGFVLRGHQFTDQNGKYSLETIIPGEYTGRTPHIHVKVKTRENGPELITQLFFPGVTGNQNDAIFNKDLLIDLTDGSNGKVGTFNFIVNTNL